MMTSYLEQMFTHVVAEVLEKRHLLGECFWEHLERVEMFIPITLDVLHISETFGSHCVHGVWGRANRKVTNLFK